LTRIYIGKSKVERFTSDLDASSLQLPKSMMRISYADLLFSTSRRIRLAASTDSSPPNLVPVRNGISPTSAVDIQQEATSVVACCIQDLG